MEHPIYSLSTRPGPRRGTLSYEHDGNVRNHPEFRGLPTVFDKDILIYCVSKLMHLKNSGKPIGPKVRLTTHDLLVSTNKPTKSRLSAAGSLARTARRHRHQDHDRNR